MWLLTSLSLPLSPLLTLPCLNFSKNVPYLWEREDRAKLCINLERNSANVSALSIELSLIESVNFVFRIISKYLRHHWPYFNQQLLSLKIKRKQFLVWHINESYHQKIELTLCSDKKRLNSSDPSSICRQFHLLALECVEGLSN